MNSPWKRAMALAVMAAAFVGPVFAQEGQMIPLPEPREPRQAPDPPPSKATRITGEVKSVDGHLVTLTDGEKFLFLPGLAEHHGGELKPGATIKASYAETAGRKVVTTIHVDPM